MLLTKSAVNRLGERLAASNPPDEDDLRLLAEFQRSRDDALGDVVRRVAGLLNDVRGTREITQRPAKTLATLLDKLRRGSRLSTVQDVIGLRVVVGPPPRNQADVVRILRSADTNAKVVDRRTTPSHGYRAIHVIWTAGDFPVEIQVRTIPQHAWANGTERLADLWGRGIRYGQLPEASTPAELEARLAALAAWGEVSDAISNYENEEEAAYLEAKAQPSRSESLRVLSDRQPRVLRAWHQISELVPRCPKEAVAPFAMELRRQSPGSVRVTK